MRRFVMLAALVLFTLAASVANAVPKAEVIHFGRNMSTDAATKEIRRRGLRPADFEELLVYGSLTREELRKYPVVALGSTCTFLIGHHVLPCPNGKPVAGGDWGKDIRFLVIREVAADKSIKLADMVAAGRYDWVSLDANEKNFTVKPERFTTEGVEIVDFGRRITTKAILAELERNHLRPATIEELLAYGAAHPDEQLKHPIVALGSSWTNRYGHPCVPVLGGFDGERGLDLDWGAPDDEWLGGDRFLVGFKPVAADATPSVRNLADMVKAGHYARVDSDIIEKNFPVKPERFMTKGVEVVSFDQPMATPDVLAEFDRRGLRPAVIEELLAYGAEHPDEQRKHNIIALGSSMPSPRGNNLVPILSDGFGGRELFLALNRNLSGFSWLANHSFLAARK